MLLLRDYERFLGKKLKISFKNLQEKIYINFVLVIFELECENFTLNNLPKDRIIQCRFETIFP